VLDVAVELPSGDVGLGVDLDDEGSIGLAHVETSRRSPVSVLDGRVPIACRSPET
jgi:hypothetical protein